ncbi:MAG: DUF2267 domain-containing protein [bacterium]
MATQEDLMAPFATTIEKTRDWLRDLDEHLGTHDAEKTVRALRAVLHPLRDRLLPTEAAHLAAQLPLVLKGLYYDGWRPADAPRRDRSRDAFLARVADELQPPADVPPQDAVRGVLRLLGDRISPGEVEDIRDMLPEDLAELWPEAGRTAGGS